MLIKEYRIPMPMSVEEYRIGQLYMIQKKSREESEGRGSGVEILVNEPYTNGPGGQGQFTHKLYHFENHIPAWMRSLIPKSAKTMHEEAWNAYPYTKTLFRTDMLDKFSIEIETRYLPDPGITENIFGLNEADLKNRIVDVIDIVRDSVSHYDSSEDPKIFQSEKTRRGPLTDNWLAEYRAGIDSSQMSSSDLFSRRSTPIMCSYKLIKTEFRYWGIQNRIEHFIDYFTRRTMVRAHRQAWCWQDEYNGLTMGDIRRLERETQSLLASKYAALNEHDDAAGLDQVQPVATSSTTAAGTSADFKPRSATERSAVANRVSRAPTVDSEFFDCLEFEDMNPGGSTRPTSIYTTVSDAFPSKFDSDSDSESDFVSVAEMPLAVQRALAGDAAADTLGVGRQQCLVLFFEGGSLGAGELSSSGCPATLRMKQSDFAAFQTSLFDVIVRSFPPLEGRIRCRLVACPDLPVDAQRFVSELCPSNGGRAGQHFLAFSALLTAGFNLRSFAYQQSLASLAEHVNGVYEQFLLSSETEPFTGKVFIVGDCLGAIYAHDLLHLFANKPAATEQRADRNSKESSVEINEDNETICPADDNLTLVSPRSIATDSDSFYSADEARSSKLSSADDYASACSNSFDRSVVPVVRLASQDQLTPSCEPTPTNSEVDLSFIDGFATEQPAEQPSQRDHLCPTASSRQARSNSEGDEHDDEAGSGSLSKSASSTTLAEPDADDRASNDLLVGRVSLSFNVESLFAFGSPLGFVLAQRSAGSPAPCAHLYNLFYDVDPLASRLQSILTDATDLQVTTQRSLRDIPNETLNLLLHSSYFESVEVLSIFLRLVAAYLLSPSTLSPAGRSDALLPADDQPVSVAAASSSSLGSPTGSSANGSSAGVGRKSSWLRRRSNVKSKSSTAPFHRANDVVWSRDSDEQVLMARFAYGPLDVLSLTEEQVDIYIMPDSALDLKSERSTCAQSMVSSNAACQCCFPDSLATQRFRPDVGRRSDVGLADETSTSAEKHVDGHPVKAWRYVGTQLTDNHGRITFRLPVEHRLGVGVHSVRMIVRGDGSGLEILVLVVPPKTQCVIFSIDGTFAASMSVSGGDPRVRGGCVDLVRFWLELGYLIIYVTARPDVQQRRVVPWLRGHNFPAGLVFFVDGISSEPLKAKGLLLQRLVASSQLQVKAAYGSHKDITIYQSLGIESDWIVAHIGRRLSLRRQKRGIRYVRDGFSNYLRDLRSTNVPSAAAVGRLSVGVRLALSRLQDRLILPLHERNRQMSCPGAVEGQPSNSLMHSQSSPGWHHQPPLSTGNSISRNKTAFNGLDDSPTQSTWLKRFSGRLFRNLSLKYGRRQEESSSSKVTFY